MVRCCTSSGAHTYWKRPSSCLFYCRWEHCWYMAVVRASSEGKTDTMRNFLFDMNVFTYSSLDHDFDGLSTLRRSQIWNEYLITGRKGVKLNIHSHNYPFWRWDRTRTRLISWLLMLRLPDAPSHFPCSLCEFGMLLLSFTKNFHNPQRFSAE